MENSVEEIKKKIDIIDFIGSFITVKKTGRNFKAVCPFHSEKTPSFIISPERQIWHCFGACQEGGDVIKFLMKWENITFFEALKELAEKTGVRLQHAQFEDNAWKRKERLMSINTLSAEFFEYMLHKTKFGEKALVYLKERDINVQIARKFQIGYAPNSWNSLIQFLKKKKYNEKEMLDTGLLVRSDRGGLYDRFRGRLVFPIKDPRGNVIGFSGRSLEAAAGDAKYINTPETLLYHKRETLYGIDLANESIKKQKNVFIVEGEFDMISPYQHGFENFVAIKGSALTREQLMMLKRYTSRITLTLDTDAAGEEAMKRGIEEAELLDFEIEVVMFDDAKDPDEAVRKDETIFKKKLQKPLPIYDFLIEIAQKKYPEDDPFNKKKIGNEVIPYVERIQNPIVQSHYVKKLSELLKVSESSIYSLMKRLRLKKKQSNMFVSIAKKGKELSREIIIQQYILSLMFQNENPYKCASELFTILTPQDFSFGSYQKICDAFLTFRKKYPESFHLPDFVGSLSNELHPVFDEIFLFASNELGFEHEHMTKLAYEIKRFALKRHINKVVEEKDPEESKKKQELSVLIGQLKEVEKKLLTL